MKVKSESEVTQSCPTLSNPMDRSLPGSSIHGIFQARVLEWVAIAFSVDPTYLCLKQRGQCIFAVVKFITTSGGNKKKKMQPIPLSLLHPFLKSLG